MVASASYTLTPKQRLVSTTMMSVGVASTYKEPRGGGGCRVKWVDVKYARVQLVSMEVTQII